MFKTIIASTLVLSTFLASGCGTTAKFTYPADGRNIARPGGTPIAKRVAVTPFDDLRGNTNQYGTLFLYLIPLMPRGRITYERPDAARRFATIRNFEFDPSEDLAKAAAYSLRRSGVFQDAFFTYGGEKDRAQFLLEGEMNSTTYRGDVWTYGLSIFGAYPWVIGLPAATSKNNLALELKLTDQEADAVVWRKRYDLDWRRVQGLYYRWGHDARGFSYLMQQIMNDAVREMGRELRR